METRLDWEQPSDPLTKQELVILNQLAQGLSNKDIAEALGITEGTVKGHLNKIFGKLNVRNRVEAVVKAQYQRIL